MKPILVHLTPPGPNPWKVIDLLEELEIPYEVNSFAFSVIKKEPYISINPNGRVPAIEDPNTGLTLWETGAIILYLIEQYDKAGKLTHSSLKERHLQNQWLMFQLSGQGPYFGQASWFNFYHPEKIPTAQERYNNEAHRIISVLEGALEGKHWLVGDKMTYADLSFVPWNNNFETIVGKGTSETKFDAYPNVKAWHERMVARSAWQRAMTKKLVLMDEQGLDERGMPKGMKTFQDYEAQMKADEEAAATTAAEQ